MRQFKFKASGLEIVLSADAQVFPEMKELLRIDAITPTQHKHVGLDSNSELKDLIAGLRNLANALEKDA